MKRTRLGEFEIVVLAALVKLADQAYGMAVRKEIEATTGQPVSIGAIYTTLRRLEKKGYVSARMGDPSPERGGRAKRFFTVEAAGVHALKQSVETIQRMTRDLAEGWA